VEIMADMRADLAGPGIGSYDDVEKILHIEENLSKELNLMRVTVPLIVDAESGVNRLIKMPILPSK